MRRACIIQFLCAGWLLITAAAASGLHPLDGVRAAAEQEALRLVGEVTDTGTAASASLDSRLRLPSCSAALTTRAAAGTHAAGRVTIEVACPTPTWRVFVPVAIQARIAVMVAARPLAARTALTASDLRPSERDLAALPYGHFRAPADLIGQELVRPLTQGEVLTPQVVRSLPLVRRGQSVIVVARSGQLSVRAQGEALAAAGLDQRIRVRNLSSGRNVEGVVRGPDLVEVPL